MKFYVMCNKNFLTKSFNYYISHQFHLRILTHSRRFHYIRLWIRLLLDPTHDKRLFFYAQSYSRIMNSVYEKNVEINDAFSDYVKTFPHFYYFFYQYMLPSISELFMLLLLLLLYIANSLLYDSFQFLCV